MDRRPRHRQSARRTRPAVRRPALLVSFAIVSAAAAAMTGFSSAAFTSTTSAGTGIVRAAADWTLPTVDLSAPASTLKGQVTISATAADADSGVKNVVVQYRAAQGTAWTVLCSDTSAPYTCAWDTTSVTNGAYELRAVATDVVGNTATSAPATTMVDNLAPVVTMSDPGTPLSGTRTFAATASDAHSGLAKVTIEYSSGSGYATLCTMTAAPWSCAYDTTRLGNGTFSFRAVATDRAGNTSTSGVVTNRVVSNIVSSVALADPGTHLRGAVTLNATGTSTGTIRSILIQRARTGTTTWTDICSDNTAPYTCVLNTTTVADGPYDLRAILTDGAGAMTTSAVVTNRIVDNTPVRAADVRTTNVGVAGRIDTGDTIAFTFSEQVDLGTVLAGWDGSARSVNVRIRDGLLISLNPNKDVLDVTGVNLGSVQLDGNFAPLLGTVNLNAVMTAAVDPAGRSVVTLRFTENGSTTSGSNGTMVWNPSASVTDLAGNPTSPASVSESGAPGRVF